MCRRCSRAEPGITHWATDNLGHDMLTLLLRGIQVSLSIAFLGTLFGALAGTAIGFAAAKFGGWVDGLVGVLIDFQAALPFLVLALALLAVMPDADISTFIILMCIYGWERYAPPGPGPGHIGP